MKKFLKSFFPRFYQFQQEWNQRRKERRLFRQRLVQIRCGSFDIEAPEKHPLVGILKTQPYRDVCIGISAKYLSAKYPGATMVDIGANIGDTAAIIATQAKNPLVLVEASDYFFEILSRNAARIPNIHAVKKVLISDGAAVSGSLRHWGGNRQFSGASRRSPAGQNTTAFRGGRRRHMLREN